MIYLKIPIKLISKDNSKIFNRSGRPFLSREFRDFEETVRNYAKIQYKGVPLEGDISVEIIAYFTNKRHCDCFNLPKGIMDALQKICFKNDKQIKSGMIEVIEDCHSEYFTITIEKIGE